MSRSPSRRETGAMRDAEPPVFGRLLRGWRLLRHRSQLDLSLDAGVSSRHLSFLETGRARPSRAMVLLLSAALDVPLRDRNALLQSAGFAAAYRETGLEEPAMAEMVTALRLILEQHEPFPARAIDRGWNLVMVNHAYLRTLGLIFGKLCPLAPYAALPPPRLNVLRTLFDPNGIRPDVLNWDEVARDVLVRLHRDAAFGDSEAGKLLDELAREAELPVSKALASQSGQALVIPVEIRGGSQVLRFFTTIATLGSPQDITLAELRIEMFHAADASTEAAMRADTVPDRR